MSDTVKQLITSNTHFTIYTLLIIIASLTFLAISCSFYYIDFAEGLVDELAKLTAHATWLGIVFLFLWRGKLRHKKAIAFFWFALVLCAIASSRSVRLLNETENAKNALRKVTYVFDKAIEINPRVALISDLTKAIEINPRNDKAYIQRGFTYSYEGAHDLAISDFTKAIEINPRRAVVYRLRGVAYVQKGQNVPAISDFTKAIEINPRYDKAYFSRAVVYSEEGGHDLAISDLTKSIEINPRDAKAYDIRAFNYTKKDEFDKAWEDVHKAQSLGYQVDPELLKVLRQALGR